MGALTEAGEHGVAVISASLTGELGNELPGLEPRRVERGDTLPVEAAPKPVEHGSVLPERRMDLLFALSGIMLLAAQVVRVLLTTFVRRREAWTSLMGPVWDIMWGAVWPAGTSP